MKIRKVLLSCALVMTTVLVCLLALPTEAEAATSGYYTYTVSNGEATITDVDESISGDITIPDTLGGYPITTIGNLTFSDCDSLTVVYYPGTESQWNAIQSASIMMT